MIGLQLKYLKQDLENELREIIKEKLKKFKEESGIDVKEINVKFA